MGSFGIGGCWPYFHHIILGAGKCLVTELFPRKGNKLLFPGDFGATVKDG